MDPLLQQGITACGIETAELQALAIFSPSSSAPCCNRALPLAVLKQYYFRRDTYINSTPLQQGITACGIETGRQTCRVQSRRLSVATGHYRLRY